MNILVLQTWAMALMIFVIYLQAQRITRLENAVGELYQEILEACEALDDDKEAA